MTILKVNVCIRQAKRDIKVSENVVPISENEHKICKNIEFSIDTLQFYLNALKTANKDFTNQQTSLKKQLENRYSAYVT